MPSGALSNPFPGLRPFESDEDHLFFGREKQIDELIRRLRSCRFLSVVGASGSGKSSLVRAGLIPALQSGSMAKAGSNWRIATFRPGEDPTRHLAAALSAPDVLGTDPNLASMHRVLLEATLHRSTRGLIEAVRQARISPYDNVLILVDQFEELFRFHQDRHVGTSRDEALVFVKLLLEAAQQGEIPIYIVVTMRSDFLGVCTEFPGLPEAVNAGLYLVPRMTRDQLRSAITGPVAVAGGEIAPRLVLRLLNDVGDDPDQLPVLQHALMRTWDHWLQHPTEEPIDFPDYEAIGTMRQALSLHAEEAYQESGGGHGQQIAERIFKALTDTFSDPRGIRRPTSIQQLSAICEVLESDVTQIIDIFRRPGRSFLMPSASVPLDSRSIIDISHESLMRCWSRLITWAEEERLSARAYTRVSQAAAWFEEGTAGLWHNPELELGLRWRRENHPTQAWAEHYNPAFARAMHFLDRSEAERDRSEAERERRRKRKIARARQLAGVLGALLLLVLFFLYLAIRQRHRAETNLQLAREAVDESLSSAGREQGRETADPPQLEEFRKELLKKAENFYSNYLVKQRANDPDYAMETALVHSKLGDINRLLEKHEDAVEQYQNAVRGLEELQQKNPQNTEYRQALAYAHHWLGETLRLWMEEAPNLPYKRSDAENEYDLAMRIQQVLHDDNPSSADYQQDLARSYYNRGILRYDGGDLKAAESDFREAIRLLEPLVENKASSYLPVRGRLPTHDLARAYNDLGNLSRDQGDLSRAQDYLARAIRILEALSGENPENWEFKVELAKFHNNLAFLLLEKGDLEMTKQQNQKALDSIEDLSTPSALLETERAKAHMLYLYLGESPHPDFHVLYKKLGEQYANFAKESLDAGSLELATLALRSLEGVLSKVAEPDRTILVRSYEELQKRLQEKKKNSK